VGTCGYRENATVVTHKRHLEHRARRVRAPLQQDRLDREENRATILQFVGAELSLDA
jgi:hypothetical protein